MEKRVVGRLEADFRAVAGRNCATFLPVPVVIATRWGMIPPSCEGC